MGSEAAQLLEAADFAAHKHRQQRRKDPEGTPYINHPIGGRAGWEAVLAARGGWGLTETGTQCASKLFSAFFQSQAVYTTFHALSRVNLTWVVGRIVPLVQSISQEGKGRSRSSSW